MTERDQLDSGRKAYQAQKWGNAYTCFTKTAKDVPLEPDDLQKLATSAYLIGKESESVELWSQAHQGFLKLEDKPGASLCAFWLGMILSNQGEKAQGGGWIARAQTLLNDYKPDCAEQGFLLIPQALQHMSKGDNIAAYSLFNKTFELGKRFNIADLTAFGLLGRGQVLIRQNKIQEGTSLIDEAMIAVISGELFPIAAGIIYCAVIETCQKIYDLNRAQEWTAALNNWCYAHPDMKPFRGQCLVRRAEILQVHGEWKKAFTEIKQACNLLSTPPGELAAGEAFYRQAELYRLQGEFSKAIEQYRQASTWGLKPQPGLALLRLTQGKSDVANAAIRQVEKEKKDPISRSKILPAYVEIMLENGDIESAESASQELKKIAGDFQAPYIKAISLHASGSISLAKNEAHTALDKLNASAALFKSLGATYEFARTRSLIGQSYNNLEDLDSAIMELTAAADIFRQLGAIPDKEKVDIYIQNISSHHKHVLTKREKEVLQLLASGKTNKEIATNLFVSERTIDRHVSSILSKLNVPSRAAATAYAYKHNLL